MIPWLTQHSTFPPVATALRTPNGLLAAGGELTPVQILAAYEQGIFPWFNPGEPILWWKPRSTHGAASCAVQNFAFICQGAA